MARVISLLLGACALCAASFAQPAVDLPGFEVASVKRADPKAAALAPNDCHGGPSSTDPGLLTCTHAALSMLVSMAYDLQFYELITPEWMTHGGAEQGYDIVAKIPAGATKEQYRLMLRRLLAERFSLVAHRESRILTNYALTLGKGKPTLTAAQASATGPEYSQNIIDGHLRVVLRKKTMGSLANFLTTMVTAPVADETNLSGTYDITLEFMPDDRWRGFPYLPAPSNAKAADSVPNLALAIQSQLGLKFETRKGPVSVMVVDSASKVPVEN